MGIAAMTLRLHGYPVSQYFNAARAALIEKGTDFQVIPTRAAQDDAFLAPSAMGKIPYLVTPHGSIAETVAILEYIRSEERRVGKECVSTGRSGGSTERKPKNN